MATIPAFTVEWDGGAVLESSGLMSINGVSLDNAPDWSGFRWSGFSIIGTVAVASQSAFLAALTAGATGLPLTVRRCVDAVSVQVTTGAYVLRTEVLQPGGHATLRNKACRHVIVADTITWTFSGTAAVGSISTIPALSRWGFVEYGNFICGLPRASLRASGEYLGTPQEYASDCNDATEWGTNGFPVAGQWWAADVGSVLTGERWRIRNSLLASSAATAVTVYGTNDVAKFTALSGAGYDFVAAGWTTVASLTGLVTGDNSGSLSGTFRYWAFRATAGGANGWSVYEFELRGGA